MLLKEKINADFMEAYKNKDMEKKNFLGVVKGAIQTQEGKSIESTDENVLKVIKSVEKGINQTIESLKGEGADTSAQEKELSFLKPYLPTLMSEIDVRTIVKEIVSRPINKNIGLLMGTFVKENKGKGFDIKVVNKIIQEEIA